MDTGPSSRGVDAMSTDVRGDLTSGPETVDLDDPRQQIEVGVLMANGRLAGRQFSSRAEAEAWARPDEGERVVEFNILCECSFIS